MLLGKLWKRGDLVSMDVDWDIWGVSMWLVLNIATLNREQIGTHSRKTKAHNSKINKHRTIFTPCSLDI